ncbi:MAG: Gfo/Idh/MocA family oxidoreductase [Cyclobacteriaceae bacterium]
MKIQRRKFLKSAASGAMLVSALGVNPLFGRKTDEKLGVALVGLGYYSTDLLAPALQLTEECELRGIVTGSPEKIPVWQEKYAIRDSNVYNYENMHQIANNDDIDVVYIVLPPSMHSEYSIIAAEAGKHVWCEKPMAKTVEECQAIIDACNRNNVYLSIGYRMQHEPNTRRIMKWAKTQPYGSIENVLARAGYRESRKGHWKLDREMGGGAMYDMGVYPLNAARYSTGLEPVSVSARYEYTRPDLFNEVEEIAHFTLNFPKGIVANCTVSFAAGLNELRVTCSDGWYELQPFQAYNGIQGAASDGTRLDARIPNQQARQMDDDALAIKTSSQVMVPGEEGLRDIRIVEAIHRSARNGSSLVTIE